jgi:alpha-ketoglutarate-dependent taurine dioxygenase
MCNPPDWIQEIRLSASDATTLEDVSAQLRAGLAKEQASARVSDAVQALDAVPQLLENAGAIIVSNVPVADDGALIACCTACGNVVDQGAAGMVYGVAPATHGAVARSRSVTAFELHTDSSLDSIPHRFIALAVVRADPRGGRTLLARLSDALERLDEEMIETLSTVPAPFAWETQSAEEPQVTHQPILALDGETFHARWRADLVRRGCSITGAPEALLTAIDAVETAFNEVVSVPFPLRAGQVLILDNARVLHGRTPVLSQQRELKRLKIHSRLSPQPGSTA